MAERPPKAPLYHVKQPPPSKESDSEIAAWGGKFSEFCRVKRAAHRSAAIESTSSMDGPEFDRLDDDLFLTMFPDNQASNVMPEVSEHNSNTICEADDKKELDEADSGEYKGEPEVLTNGTEVEEMSPSEVTSSLDGEGAPSTDPKRVKRILANRQSAQRSRVRKLHYISELERNVQLLQNEVTTLAPRVAYLDHQRTLLTISNGHLRQKMASFNQDQMFKKRS
ncbi:basic leucine zipper 19-like isoform X2 [Carex rostrata]